MAKEIKVVECPKCGSTSKTEIRPDYFRCNSCGTEYFLDNDDININIRQTPSYTPPPTVDISGARKALTIVGGAILAVIILGGILSSILRKTVSNGSSSPYSVTTSDKKSEDINWSNTRILPFAQKSTETPVIIMVGKKEYGWGNDKNPKNGVYAALYDPLQKKEIKSQKIMEAGENYSSIDVGMRQFSDGNIYFTINKNKIYKLDNTSLGITDVTTTIFNGQSALSAGVATMELMYEDDGEGFKLMTNDGGNYYYFPQVNKLYNKDELYKAEGGFNTLLPSAKEKYYYEFTDESLEFANEKLQLLKILYKDNVGGPKDMETSPRWSKDFGGSGIFTERDPYKKVLISDYSMKRGRIISFKDITPGRLYFKPAVLYSDDQTLLIKFTPDANPNTPQSIQSLDINTGAVKWTYPTSGKSSIENLVRFKDGFVGVFNSDEVLMLDNGGKETATFKIKN